MTFIDFSNYLVPLSDSAISELDGLLKTKLYEKGAYILNQDQVCRNMYFVKSGLVKMFCYAEGKEFIMNFFQEEKMFTVLDSFPFQKPSQYNIIALEDTELQFLPHESLEYLSSKYHSVETLYRKILLHASDKMMQRIREMLIQTHANHYQQFLTDNHDLIQRLSLGDLACYLGITQVSLSRIRAKK
ncbi:MAG: Crp/Fnr family transcriptional regulator [Bacteroidales bacterium]|nr:Crp/Fnr family transcriptional regulator [Bacteroidales bacterium]